MALGKNVAFLVFCLLIIDLVVVLNYSNPYRWIPLFTPQPPAHPLLTQQNFKQQPTNQPFPLLIHQSWKSRSIPSRVWPFVTSWKEFHPKWDYIFWTDEDNFKIWETFPVFQKYRKMIEDFRELHPILVVDITRYALLYIYGGIYADIDFEAIKPFDELLDESSILVGSEPPEHSLLLYGKDIVLCNALMVSRPKQLFWLYLLDFILNEYFLGGFRCFPDPIACTGPIIMQRAYEKFIKEYPVETKHLLVTNNSYFYPAPANRGEDFWRQRCSKKNLPQKQKAVCSKYLIGDNTIQKVDNSSSFAVHHWHCGWCGDKNGKKEGQMVRDIEDLMPGAKSPDFTTKED